MMDRDNNSAYTESVYGMNSNSKSSEEECKPQGCNCKKSQRSKSCGRCRKQKKDKDNKPMKNTCPHCKKFHHKKPHQVKPDKCMWNRKYKGYRFKLICDELKVAFKPCHKFSAELGGYAGEGN